MRYLNLKAVFAVVLVVTKVRAIALGDHADAFTNQVTRAETTSSASVVPTTSLTFTLTAGTTFLFSQNETTTLASSTFGQGTTLATSSTWPSEGLSSATITVSVTPLPTTTTVTLLPTTTTTVALLPTTLSVGLPPPSQESSANNSATLSADSLTASLDTPTTTGVTPSLTLTISAASQPSASPALQSSANGAIVSSVGNLMDGTAMAAAVAVAVGAASVLGF